MLLPLLLPAQGTFTDVTQSAGIDHQFKVYEGLFGGGICVFDLNEDGYEDLFVTSGMGEDRLYLNNGDGTFKNIYEGSGLELTRHFVTQGVVGADVNRDGWVDLYITTLTTKDSIKTIPRERNLLFLNNGDMTFRDATAEFGLGDLYSFSTGANFGDFNADGYPDLYVGNYFQDYQGDLIEISDATIASSHQTAKGYLLLNKKGKKFQDVYQEYGLTHKGFGFGGLFTDFDNDGDQDLLVHHDFGYKRTPNMLLENLYPKTEFRDVAEELGMDLKINGMGAAVGDVNDDGYMDFFISNIRFNRFMISQGPGKPYVDRLKEMGMTFVTISWGANFADFDNDGDLDLFVNNGDLNPNCVPMGNFFFENDNGKFKDIARAMGVQDYGLGRGSVVFDMDNDGDLDILQVNQGAIYDYPVESITRLYRNDWAKGNWSKIALRGTQAESHGLGSRVEVYAGGRRMLREIDGGGSSHISQNSTITHFGLGNAEVIDSIVVLWTGGHRQVLEDQAVNTLLTVVEPEMKKAGNGGYLILLLVLAMGGYLMYRMLKP
ncbi:MAG: CRTAC1 family protein [Saprospiraceae bacterium]